MTAPTRPPLLAAALLTSAGLRASAAPPPAPDAPDAGATLADNKAPPPSVSREPTADRLNLRFTGYGWLTSVEGTTGAGGLEVDVDESFFDLLGESDRMYGLMGALDAE